MNIDVYEDVLGWIDGDPCDALALLEHPHNELLTSDSNGFHMLHPERDVTHQPRGLTTPLSEVFWSSKGLPSGKRKRGAAAYRHDEGQKSRTHRHKARTVQDAARGMLRGNIVHGQIEDLVMLDSVAFFKKHRQGAHKWSLDALEAIRLHGARPFVCELGVVDSDLGIATRVDMVAVRSNGHPIFVETKTGYDSNEAWRGARAWMRGKLHGVLVDSALNRAIVQVVMGAMLAIMSRGLNGVVECWVLHISSEGTEITEVSPKFIADYGPVIYQEMKKHQRALAKKKQAAKKKKTTTTTTSLLKARRQYT